MGDAAGLLSRGFREGTLMPATAKQFVGAIALVRRDAGDGSEWLALWNEGRGCFHFLEAHKLDDESYRQSLVREIEWTTDLRTGKDYLVSGGPRAHLAFGEVEACGEEPIWYAVEFYLVELMGRRHRDTLAADARVRWVTAADVETGRIDGRPVCPRLLALLRRADIFAPWQVE